MRGIEASRIRLGVVQPGESIADFNDALNTLRGSLAYLYTNPTGDRYWFDTRPTLRKTAQDRATQFSEIDVEYEIETRLRKLRKEEPFAGLHVCPSSSLNVTDDQAVRLVILGVKDTYRSSNLQNQALTAAADILDNRGFSPRIYRNMLAFIAPDQEQTGALKQAVREWLAWKSIVDDKEALNLDVAQTKEADNSLHRSNETVESRIKETYCWLLAPSIDLQIDMKNIQWEAIRISGGSDSIVTKAANKMLQQELLITKWAPALLKMALDDVLWKDSNCIQIKKLWEYLCTYCYLPRLARYSVLEDAVQTGVNSKEYFAIASGRSDDRFLDLKFNQYVGFIQPSDYLVKKAAAFEQIAMEKQEPVSDGAGPVGPSTGTLPDRLTPPEIKPGGVPVSGDSSGEEAPPLAPKNTHFYMSATLDNTRINRDVQRYVEEIISHLTSVDGCKVEVSLEVIVQAPEGLPMPIVRTVMENCRTLKVKDFGVDN